MTTVVGHDADYGQTLTYSLAGGADAAAFAIDGASGVLSFVAAPDFEVPADANKDNVYEVVVKVSDGAGGSDSQAIGVTVTDVNAAPTITSGATGTVAENASVATVVYDAAAKDDGENSGTLTYSLAASGDSKLFDIDAGTGQVTFKAPPDFEKPRDAGNNVYEITVQASDGSLAASQAVSITVTDQNDMAPVITTEADLSVAENTLVAAALTSTDVDTVGTAPAVFSISGGPDAGLFDVTAGNLVFKKAPDFETDPHSYQVEVTASDGVNHNAKLLTVTLTDLLADNNTAPTITSGATGTVAENAPAATVVYDAEAKDDGGTLTYSLASGGDGKLFNIDAGTGQVTFKAPADFEKPGDADGNNVYEITVQASDGSLAATQAVSIKVTDQNDVAPVIATQAALSVAENTLVVAPLTSTDVDTVGPAPAEFSVRGGADAALFDVAGGNLVFRKAPDYETEAHSYQVEVTASDGVNHSAKSLTITLTDQNDTAPVITTEAALSVVENMLVVAALTSSDLDTVGTAPAEFSITGGADAALFEIAAGNLVFRKAPDFETDPHSYQVEVTASDSVNHSAKLLTITLTDQNDNPPVITTEAALSVAEDTLVVAALTSTDADTVGTAPAKFSVSGGPDAALFDVAGGNLVFKKAPDFETDPHGYQVEVTASDGVNKSAKLLTVTLTDLLADNNTAPSITSNGGQGTASLSVAENTTSVTTVIADDTDYGQKLTFSLSGGADAAAFAIDGTSGVLSFVAAPDFETPADANKDNVYEVVVKASDGAGGSDSQAIGVTVTDVNKAPMITSGAAGTVAENAPVATVVYDAETKDDGEDRGTLTYSLAASGDSKLFDIDASTGQVTFKAPPDFDKPGDADGNNVYEIKVQASDGSLAASQAVSITVTDQNDVAPVITTEAALSVVENTLVVAALTSTDNDTVGTAPAEFSVSGGPDAGLFDVAGGNLVFKKVPDFETDPHSYQVEVTASDGVNHSAKLLTVTLTDLLADNNTAPTITSGTAGTVAENAPATTVVYDAEAKDDGDTLTYSLAASGDSKLFNIDAGTGQVTFKAPADFEKPGDADGNNVYEITVQASDGSLVGSQAVSITVTDQNDMAPVITTEADLSVAENTLVAAALTSTDVDTVGTNPARFSVTGGADAALFDVAGDNLVFRKAPDYETDPHSYQVEVTASDGVNHNATLLTVTLTDLLGDNNTVPSITSDGGQGTASLSVAENTKVVTTVVGHDTDYGQALTYSLAGGADAAAFAIDGASGVLSFVAAPDFEAPADSNKDNVYEVVVKASDGAGGSDSQAIGVTVTNVNEAPTITSGAAGTVAENAPAATVVYDAEAKDDGEDRDTLTYSLAASGDSKLFNIDAGTGQVTFKAPPDFEKPGDVDGNNVYQITVQASDGSLEASQAVSITVTDQNDVAPVITTEAALSVAENTLVVAALTSTDMDAVGPAPAEFSITGGADAALFDLTGGNLVFRKAADFETDPHSYQVEVTASDGVNHSAKLLNITLNDQNDTAPVITTEAALSVAENTLVVAALTSTDKDTVGTAPAVFSIAGGADGALFDVAAGNLVFRKAPDFETDPHSYHVEVTASDGVNHSAKLLTVTLTDLLADNNTAPSITSDGGQGMASLSVAENMKAVTTVVARDTDDGQTLTYSLAGGADAAAFAIDGASGVLSFVAAPDFEAPADSNKDNVYEVVVKASDGAGGSDSQVIGVTVTDVNAAPTITSGAAGTVVESAPVATVVYDAAGKDDGENSGTLTYSLAAGGDSKLFNIDAGTGQVTFKAPADFEAPGDADGNNVYQITVQASDGSLAASQAVSITVTDQNDVAPVITTEAVLSVVENTLVVAPLTSSDADAVGATPAVFSITGGPDAGLFDVAGGNLVFKKAADFETDPHSYQVEVTASDGVNHSAKLLTITLNDQNDTAPVITTEAALSVAENTLVVAALTSTDKDTVGTAPAEFSVSGGADGALFDVAAGNLVFKKAPDFETDPHSYHVEVTASDGVNHSAKLLTVTLTDLLADNNTAPTITSGAVGTVAENAPATTVVYDAEAKDDGGTLTYSLAAGGDSKLFNIDAGTGQVTFKAPADFEKPGDADANNVYQITVQASDGSLTASQAVAITVTDQNEGAGVGGPSDHLGALKDVYIVLQGTSQLSVDAKSGVLFNDQQMSAGTADLATGPGHGSVQLNSDGSFVYSLSDSFAGMDSFSYKATSTLGALDSAEALVYVVPVVAGPTITTLDLFSLSREEQLAATYVSFLGRGADRDGFDFWMKQYVAHETTANPGDILAGISSSFAISEEAKGIYSFLANPHGASNAQIVSFLDSVYLNLFNRTTDEAGRAYWSNEITETLAAGGSVGSVLMNIVGGAQNTAAGLDITTLMSKVAVNLEYIHAQQEVGNAWTFADDQAQAVDLLKPVASDPQSVLIGVVNAHNIVAADIV